MKLIRKLSLQLIILQLLALIFFEEAFRRFNAFMHADLYECLIRSNPDRFDQCAKLYLPPEMTVGQLMSETVCFMLYGLCFGLLLTGIMNLAKRKSLLNTVSIVLLYLLLFFTGAFKWRITSHLINTVATFFSSEIRILSLIESLIALIVGILLVWLSVKDFTRAKER